MPIPMITQRCRSISCFYEDRGSRIEKIIQKIAMNHAKRRFSRVRPFLSDPVLDIGVGAGAFSCLLKREGFQQSEGVDVANLSIFRDVVPTLYDGAQLPYADHSFSTALLINVLHHCKHPLSMLKEAKRVANRVIFIEDTYRNPFEKFIVSINDMIGNFEFYFHPYRTATEWAAVIRQHRWEILHNGEWSQLGYGALYSRYCMFVVE